MKTPLINIEALATFAEARGFRVGRYRVIGSGQVSYELFAPEHEGPDAMQSGDAVYSCATYVIGDGPGISYGYNGAFHGPWHFGHTPRGRAAKLLSHPLMMDFAL